MVSKSQFKPKVFEYLRRVESGAQEICITDHGEPMVKVIAMRAGEDDELAAMRGLVLAYDRPDQPLDVEWEARS
jgi:prevent-host-death family protein